MKCKNNKAILLALLLASLIVLIGIMDLLRNVLNALAADIITVVIFVVAAYFTLRYLVYEYKYSLIADELIITKLIGKKEQVLMRIGLDQIQIIAPKGSEQLKAFHKANEFLNSCGLPFYSHRYCGVFEAGGKTVWFMFQPSAALLDLMKKRMKDKVIYE